jgi:SAM-dependent methyltransferase
MTLRDLWDEQAEQWALVARTPGRDDHYTEFHLPRFLEFLPPPTRTLDIGCGEGRLSRELGTRGYEVVGLDASATLVRLAQEADPAGDYVVADAAAMPFPESAFELALAFFSLHDMDDMAGAVREAARVLATGGRFCLAVEHPVVRAGTFASHEPDAPFEIECSYLETQRRTFTSDRDGFSFTFHSYRRSLESYTGSLEDAGFLIEALREPVPEPSFVEGRAHHGRAWRIPHLLLIRAVKH